MLHCTQRKARVVEMTLIYAGLIVFGALKLLVGCTESRLNVRSHARFSAHDCYFVIWKMITPIWS